MGGVPSTVCARSVHMVAAGHRPRQFPGVLAFRELLHRPIPKPSLSEPQREARTRTLKSQLCRSSPAALATVLAEALRAVWQG